MTYKTFSILKANQSNLRGISTVVGTLGFVLAISACAPKDEPTKTVTVEAPTTVNVTPAPKYLTLMECSKVGPAASLKRSYVVFVQDGRLSFSKGTLNEPGYEHWNGTVEEDGTLNVEGTYKDVPGEPGVITFTGNLTEKTINLSGQRGPRECTVTGKLPNA